MANSRFVYVTFIRTTPEKLWEALTKPEFTKLYWGETWQDSTWEKGADWKLMIPDGRVGDEGKVLEIDRPRRLVVSWKNLHLPELANDGPSRCSFDLQQQGDMVKLTVTHESDTPDSKLVGKVAQGWPVILASLKSLLETGEPLEATRRWPKKA